MHAHETTSSQLTNGSYSRRCERAISLEKLALATLPPNLRDEACADLKDLAIRVGTVWVGYGKDEWGDKLRLQEHVHQTESRKHRTLEMGQGRARSRRKSVVNLPILSSLVPRRGKTTFGLNYIRLIELYFFPCSRPSHPFWT